MSTALAKYISLAVGPTLQPLGCLCCGGRRRREAHAYRYLEGWGLYLDLLDLLFRQYRPDILVIHLRGNDLGMLKGKALVIQVREDLAGIRMQWPGVIVLGPALSLGFLGAGHLTLML